MAISESFRTHKNPGSLMLNDSSNISSQMMSTHQTNSEQYFLASSKERRTNLSETSSHPQRLRTRALPKSATLENMLRDRLVCGINDPRIQRRLLAEPTLSYVKALELAHATETVKSNAKQLEQAMPCTAVQAISSEEKKGGARRHITSLQSTPTQNRCYRCGGKHNSDQCYFKDSTCYHC